MCKKSNCPCIICHKKRQEQIPQVQEPLTVECCGKTLRTKDEIMAHFETRPKHKNDEKLPFALCSDHYDAYEGRCLECRRVAWLNEIDSDLQQNGLALGKHLRGGD